MATCNNCKKILQSVAHLRQCLPSYDAIQEARTAVNTRQNNAVGSEVCNRFEAGLKAIDVLEQFNLAHSSVSKPPVNQFDLSSFERLEKQLEEYEILHRKVEPSKKGRGVVTPKLRAFCKMVPKRCRETGMNMYYVNEQAGEAIHMRVLKEETNLPKCVAWLERKELSQAGKPKRKHSPAFGTRSGAQNDRAIQEERTRNELDKLSQEKATLMDSLYAKSEKSWSVSSLKKSIVSEESSSSSSSCPALKEACPADKIVRHRGNTEESKKVQLWGMQKLARKSFPDHSRRRLRMCADRVVSGDKSTPPWMTTQWENFKK
ncbi:MAG: hypothetical protein AMXMBFR44_6920 [Candidatus Campbellbacteria bacterium]